MIRRSRNVNTNNNNKNNDDDGDDDNNAVPNPEQPDPVPPIIQRAYDSGQIERIIGCDPGYREFVGVVRKDLATDNEENFLKSSKEWHHMTGFFDRQYKLKRFTGAFEKKCRKLRENREIYEETPSKKSADYHTYLDYQLDVFNESCEIKYQKRVVRLKFDAYTRTQVALHVLVKQMTKVDRRMSDAEKTVILAFGGAKFASNSPIKGYLRCPHRALQQMAREYVFVLPINEHNTSRKCSRSGRKLKKRRSVPERQSKDRFLVCPNCKPVEDGVFHDPIQWTGRVHRTFKKKHQEWKYRSICTFHRPVPEANPNPQPKQKKKRYKKQLEPKTTVIFNRDINAARNMIKKGLYMLDHLPMPNCFRPFGHQLHYYFNN
ncbi:uncharacterized protein LOC116340757 [Contarinia nasturtii]|uniref:uncharacterized protein LOC116340757 n=1 Tax=Contarinia nasturtii TaxID=265458 RepID=UPI0012D3DDB2|nr:uncharacterized protein LOC116340757 [Contarinia nasturtii]